MKKNEFFTVHLNHLSNEDAASLFVQTGEHAIPVRGYLGEIANVVLTNLQTNSAAFSAQANRQKKSKFSEEVKNDREVSANLFAEINRTVTFESKSRDKSKQKAAFDFDFFFASYSNIAKGPIGTQMKQTQEMIVKYKADPTLISAAQMIGVDNLMNELEMDNNALINVYKTRTTDSGNREASSTDLRPAATESYVDSCTIIEQAVNFMPNEQLLSLFNSMNELRKKHNALIPKNKDKGKDSPTA
jgi:hypothetical protein